MRQRIIHGAYIDMLTPDELVKFIPRAPQVTRIRATETALLAAGTGASGVFDVYKVPSGAEFAIRRVTFDLSSVTGATLAASAVPINIPSSFIKYLRSGTLIEYAVPIGPALTAKVPGAQTWGDEQGPYMRNGEVFQIDCALITAPGPGSQLTVTVEGLLTEYRKNA